MTTPADAPQTVEWRVEPLPDESSLVDGFADVDRAAWEAAVQSGPGRPPPPARRTADGLPIASLYLHEDAGVAAGVEVDVRRGAWRVARHYAAASASLAAELAADTGRGLDAAWVDARPPQGPAPGCGDLAALADAAGTASLWLHAGASASALIRDEASRRADAVLADPIESGAAALDDAAWAVTERPGLRTLALSGAALHEAGATPAQEIAMAIATGIESVRGLIERGVSPDAAVAACMLEVSLEPKTVESIAKLRAARLLWSRVAAHLGAESGRTLLWARSSARARPRRAPLTNLLRATIEAFAAAVGGADAVVVLAAEAGAEAARLAMNVQLMVRDEGGLHHVADPAAGAWAIEAHTEALARKAWTLVGTIADDGGVAAATKQGRFAEAVATAAADRHAAVATGRAPLTGVTLYPEPGDAPHAPGQGVGASWGAAFEALRDRVDALRERPRVALMRLGPVAAVRPQVDFARGVLQAGGLVAEPVGPDESTGDLTGAALAVLCGDAERLAEHGTEAAARARAAGVARVWVAGNPDDAQFASLAAAGVSERIHRKCDRLHVLTTLVDALEGGPS